MDKISTSVRKDRYSALLLTLSLPGVTPISFRSINNITNLSHHIPLFIYCADIVGLQNVAHFVDMTGKWRGDRIKHHATCSGRLRAHADSSGAGAFFSTLSRKRISIYCICLNERVLSRSFDTYVC